MKKIIRNIILKLYNYAFSEEPLPQRENTYNCVLGESSKIDHRARIDNLSANMENITIGCNTFIVGHLIVWANSGKIEIGDYCFIGENSKVYSSKHVKIGNRVQIAHDCSIFDTNVHSINPEQRHMEYIQNITSGQTRLFDLKELVVEIKDDAWLGAHVIVLKGVTIGRGAIVGAGSVVTHDIPDFSIAVGNPARVVRSLIQQKS